MDKKYQLLQSEILKARKAGDKWVLSVLSTMKGEIDNQSKTDTKDSLDDLIEKYALKSKKNLEEFKPDRFEEEIELLTPFLPREVSPEEIKAFIQSLADEDVDKKQWMGGVMRNFKGLDPKLVTQLISEF